MSSYINDPYNNSDPDPDDDADLQNEDLDAFLVLLESRLKADFTSHDLSRIISSQGTSSSSSSSGRGGFGGLGGGGSSSSNLVTTLPSGDPSTPSKFLRLVRKVFKRAAKPIRLRSLMSVLGLESDVTAMQDASGNNGNGGAFAMQSSSNNPPGGGAVGEGRKTDAIVWKLLQDAESDDETWVRVVAGIVRSMMFRSSPVESTEGGEEEKSNGEKEETTEAEKQLRKITNAIFKKVNEAMGAAEKRRTKADVHLTKSIEAEKQLRKITNAIFKKVNEAMGAAEKRRTKVRRALDQINPDNDEDENETLMEPLVINKDLCPNYVPLRYTLLPPSTIDALLPEVNANPHFASNMDAAILQMDDEIERQRAKEEKKELAMQKTQHTRTAGVGSDPRGRLGTNGRTGRGGAAAAGRGAAPNL
eukprot:CAMPEP_0183745590 /NCGR_PEP_ID=MMETSP0737-20130205/66322_1 /TAXON_ID=385413 /ORGANISM="Thalassiosira miniscula, Strain CCMP1093" /LENGTH=417 /DNA_ID=CAMNT_0025981267 /DNA_START=11 /DNA_END=1262 /DNA_ORIENTATION=+